MAKPGQGMPAKFEGECPACGEKFYEGELIEKIPQYGDKRGHIDCYRRAQNVRPTQTAQHPAAQPQTHPSQRPATTGPRADATPTVINGLAIRELWALKDAFTTAAQGLMKAAVAIENIAKAVDPHQTNAPRAVDEQPLRAVK